MTDTMIMPTSLTAGPWRRIAVIHAQVDHDRPVDEVRIRRECMAMIAAFVVARPVIDVIGTHCAPDLFIVLALSGAEGPEHLQLALDSAADHVIRTPDRFGLLQAHRTTALTESIGRKPQNAA